MGWIRKVLALTAKDIRVELRTRYAINALALFSVVTVVAVGLTVGIQIDTPSLHAGFIWIAILFSSLQAQSLSFVKEEESKTGDLLRLYSDPGVVYVGKLLFSFALSAFLVVVLVVLYVFLMDLDVPDYIQFVMVIFLGTVGLSAATTIIAAIVSKTAMKGALFAVLSFPLLLPILIAAIGGTESILDGVKWTELFDEVKILIAYPVIVVTLSYMLFEYVWNE